MFMSIFLTTDSPTITMATIQEDFSRQHDRRRLDMKSAFQTGLAQLLATEPGIISYATPEVQQDEEGTIDDWFTVDVNPIHNLTEVLSMRPSAAPTQPPRAANSGPSQHTQPAPTRQWGTSANRGGMGGGHPGGRRGGPNNHRGTSRHQVNSAMLMIPHTPKPTHPLIVHPAKHHNYTMSKTTAIYCTAHPHATNTNMCSHVRTVMQGQHRTRAGHEMSGRSTGTIKKEAA